MRPAVSVPSLSFSVCLLPLPLACVKRIARGPRSLRRQESNVWEYEICQGVSITLDFDFSTLFCPFLFSSFSLCFLLDDLFFCCGFVRLCLVPLAGVSDLSSSLLALIAVALSGFPDGHDQTRYQIDCSPTSVSTIQPQLTSLSLFYALPNHACFLPYSSCLTEHLLSLPRSFFCLSCCFLVLLVHLADSSLSISSSSARQETSPFLALAETE